MAERTAYEIVKNALDKDELDLLLLGKPEYCYCAKVDFFVLGILI